MLAASTVNATEAHDHDGLPHTLEHLIFLGSEQYPYKGILDLLANRCYASGTNAWTDIDHTAYTLSTASARGMLTLLPIYMDHILFPLLTEQAYLTEVHHITGEGEDAGVVYCEMQGSENDAESRCIRKLLEEIYAGTGYCSNTGGMMHNLRTSTSNEKVKKYHTEFYRPENIFIIVAGQIDRNKIFEALKPIEEKIKQKELNYKSVPFVRPWQSVVPPLKGTKIIEHKYPNDSEDCGMVLIGWRGPKITDADGIYELTACSVLLRYLCDTPIAPLQKALVEIENRYASDVTSSLLENSESLLIITLENVPLVRLNVALPEFRKVMKSIQDATDSLDMDRMQNIIKKTLREYLSHLENNPHNTITFSCIADMIYSTSECQFQERLNRQKRLKELETKDCLWWENLFKKYLSQEFVAVIGQPSIDLMVQMAEEESERIKQQQNSLGKDGLGIKESKLTEAIEYNDKKAPSSIISSVGVTDIEDMNRFLIQSWSKEKDECPYFNMSSLPFYGRIHHIHSQFTYITLLLDTSTLNPDERYYLPLLISVITQTSFYRNFCKMEYNILVEDIERLTNSLSINIGIDASGYFFPGAFHNMIEVYAQCEPEKYNEVVDLLWHILKKTNFEKRRLLLVAQKMVNEITTIRRQGDEMAKQLLKVLASNKDTNVYCSSILQQQRFLNNAINILEKGSDSECSKFINTFDVVRQKITSNEKVWLHFGADIQKTGYGTEAWDVFRPVDNNHSQQEKAEISGINVNYQKLLVDPLERQGCGWVVGIGGLESSHLQQYSPGPFSYSHNDLSALLVAIQYFIQLEGPLWRVIRGEGLSYGYYISLAPNEGLIKFSLYMAAHPVKAYEKTKGIIEPFLKCNSWDENLFTAAKSSLIYEVVKREESPSKLIKQSLANFFKGVDLDYNRKLVESIANTTTEDAFRVGKKWLSEMFNPTLTTITVTCNPSKINEISDSFKSMGYNNFKTYKSLEDSPLGEEKKNNLITD